jgi:U3 small nucleolar RNA-associated protein 13
LLNSFPIYDSIEGGGFFSGTSGVFLHTSGQKGELKLWKMDGLQFQQVQCIDVCRDGIIDVIGTKNDISVVTVDHNIHAFTFNDNEILISSGVRCGFNDELFDVKYSENNFVVATNSNLLKHYDSTTLACQLMIGHTDTVLCLDTIGNLSCSGSKDNTAIIWNLLIASKPITILDNQRYEMQCVLKGHTASITSIAMTEKFIVTCSDDRTMKKWSITSNLTISPECESTTLAHAKQITSVTISPNQKIIATASHDKLIKLWNTHDCSLIGNLKGHTRGVNSVQFSPDEMCLVSCGSDALIKIWSIKDQTCIKVFLMNHELLLLDF